MDVCLFNVKYVMR